MAWERAGLLSGESMSADLRAFLAESNRIEGLKRPVTDDELQAAKHFLELDVPTVHWLCRLVDVFEPGAVLRDKPGFNVRVGEYRPPPGGPNIVRELERLLAWLPDEGAGWGPYVMHVRYENIHPFTDGNGRSGRMLWLWQMERFHGGAPLGFLHHWYYQSLQGAR